MTRKMIPVEESFAAWRKDPAYVRAYDALADQFALRRGSNPSAARARPFDAAKAGGGAPRRVRRCAR
jgi:hypothetical protein